MAELCISLLFLWWLLFGTHLCEFASHHTYRLMWSEKLYSVKWLMQTYRETQYFCVFLAAGLIYCHIIITVSKDAYSTPEFNFRSLPHCHPFHMFKAWFQNMLCLVYIFLDDIFLSSHVVNDYLCEYWWSIMIQRNVNGAYTNAYIKFSWIFVWPCIINRTM